MKTINEFLIEKTGFDIKAQEFINLIKPYFDYNSCTLTESGLVFNDVFIKKNISFQNIKESLKKGTKLKSINFKNNGWINICENDNTSYTIMPSKENLIKNINTNNMFPIYSQDNTEHIEYNRFPVVSAIQIGALSDIQRVIQSVRKLSLEDANRLKSLLGPSLEEKILITIIDSTLQDIPPKNGLQNGV